MTTSVALCTFNGERFLREQIDSIINQTISVDEIIVCDDGSQDKTVEILEDYAIKFPNIFKIFINEKNLRSVKNFEKAISLCTKDIIFLCDQDDVWISEKVSATLNQFQNYPNVQVISSNAFIINSVNILQNVISIWDIAEYYFQDLKEVLLFHRNFATGATMAIRKNFASCIMPFSPEKLFHHDEWIAANAIHRNSFLFLKEKLIEYRVHKNQLVGGVILSQKCFDKTLQKITIPAEKMNSRILFSFLKKLQRKILNLENFKTIENEDFYDYILKELRIRKNSNLIIARKKFPFFYFLYKITQKI